ncbi:MAG: GspH/FimT family pseudopilin [Gammaproteobacteria bacterium]
MLAHRYKQGFTLVEMIITVAIAAIVLVMGVPGFQQLIRANRTVTEVNRLVTALSLARSEAVKRNATVHMCPASGSNCSPGGNWENGWVVFMDNVTQNGTTDAGEQIQVYERMPQGYTLRAEGTNFADWIAFQPSGQPLGSGSGGLPAAANFRVCDDTQAAAERRLIQVNVVGRANASKSNGACT